MRGLLGISLLSLLIGCGCSAATVSQEKGKETTSVAELTAQLKQGQKEKIEAIKQLEELGPKAAEAVPALVGLLDQADEYVRLRTAMALGKIGKASVPALTKALKSDKDDVRFYAVWSLALAGSNAQSASKDVIRAMADKSDEVRRKAAYALARINPETKAAVGALLKALEDKDSDVRSAASAALPSFGEDAVPGLLEVVKSDNANVRNTAIAALGTIGSEKAVPQLKILFLNPNSGSVSQAGSALTHMGEPGIKVFLLAAKSDDGNSRGQAMNYLQQIGVPAVPHIVDLLDSKHVDVRRRASQMLGYMNVQGKMVVIGLGYSLKDKDDQVRLNSLRSLMNFGTNAKLAAKYVSNVLTDDNAQVRQTAFYALRNMGVDAKPMLKKALQDKDFSVRVRTASLMINMNWETELASSILVEGLKKKDLDTQLQAAITLSNRGLRSEEVIPVLLKGIESKKVNASVRTQSLTAIQRYGRQAAKAVPAMIKLLDDPSEQVQYAALRTLRSVGVGSKQLLPKMVEILEGDNTRLKNEASQVIYAAASDMVPELIGLLKKTKSRDLKVTCLTALARSGTKGAAAAPTVINLLDDEDDQVQFTALNALRSVGVGSKKLMPAMIKILKGDNAKLQKEASQVIFNSAPGMVPELMDLLKDAKSPALKLTCLQALSMVGPKAKAAKADFIASLQNDSPQIRWTAARALGNLGPLAKDAVPALQKLMSESNNNVASAAKAAVTQINLDPNARKLVFKGVLIDGDPLDRVRQRCYHVVHLIYMKANRSYTIDLMSNWDPYLRLEDAGGRQLMQNDDGGVNLNSRMVFQPQTDGYYRVIVTSYGARRTGPYTLMIQ